MKKMLCSLFLLTFIFLASTAGAEVVNLPGEVAYEKAMDYILDLGAMPSMENEKRLIFKTDSTELKLTAKECDCGKMFGLRYIKDKRTTTLVSYRVRVKKIDEQSSDVIIKVAIEGYYDQKKSKIGAVLSDKQRDKGKILECTSTGVLEERMLEAINEI